MLNGSYISYIIFWKLAATVFFLLLNFELQSVCCAIIQ